MRLVADIGGTHARFALSPAPGRIETAGVLRVVDFPGPLEAVRAWLGGREMPEEAVLAVATPVEGDEVRFTNSPWAFSVRALAAALGVARLAVINDFVAHALALPHLAPDELEQWGGSARRPERPRVVLGPGTGLGTAALVPCGGFEQPVATEAGHISLAPETARERALLAHLAARFDHVSRERVLSGPGLVTLAGALAELEGVALTVAEPKDVLERARGGCAVCREAVSAFIGLLGAYAGDLALAHGARGGVYVLGGLLAAFGDLLDPALFRRRFEGKGRLSAWLAPIPVYRVLRTDTGLLGASAYAFAMAARIPGEVAVRGRDFS